MRGFCWCGGVFWLRAWIFWCHRVQQSVTVERGARDQSSNLGSGVYNCLASGWSCWRSLPSGASFVKLGEMLLPSSPSTASHSKCGDTAGHPCPACQPTEGWSWQAAFPCPIIPVQIILWRCLLSVIFYVTPQQVQMFTLCFLVSQSVRLWGLTVLCEPEPYQSAWLHRAA